MTDLAELQDYLRERDAALTTLNLDWARQRFPEADDAVLLLALHKARYHCKAIAPELRHESGRWLRERDYKGSSMMPLLPEGELPE